MAMTGCATPLMIAAERGDINAVKELLNQGADVNAKDEFGKTALMEAANAKNTAKIYLPIKSIIKYFEQAKVSRP